MSRILYCRFEDCREAYLSDAGKVPSICPACNRPAHWSTENPASRPSQILAVPAPIPIAITEKDRVFMKVNRILDDWPQDDGA